MVDKGTACEGCIEVQGVLQPIPEGAICQLSALQAEHDAVGELVDAGDELLRAISDTFDIGEVPDRIWTASCRMSSANTAVKQARTAGEEETGG